MAHVVVMVKARPLEFLRFLLLSGIALKLDHSKPFFTSSVNPSTARARSRLSNDGKIALLEIAAAVFL